MTAQVISIFENRPLGQRTDADSLFAQGMKQITQRAVNLVRNVGGARLISMIAATELFRKIEDVAANGGFKQESYRASLVGATATSAEIISGGTSPLSPHVMHLEAIPEPALPKTAFHVVPQGPAPKPR